MVDNWLATLYLHVAVYDVYRYNKYSINNDMATIAPNAITIAFGALDKYLVRRVKDLSILRLVERFADYGQIAFLGFSRYDANLLDAGTHPVKYLANTY